MSVRWKFGMLEDDYTNATRIIIAKFDDNAYVGFIVDEVMQIVTLNDTEIGRPTFSTSNEADGYLRGIGKNNDMLISLLDMNTIVGEVDNA